MYFEPNIKVLTGEKIGPMKHAPLIMVNGNGARVRENKETHE
jgi:hypothetical protein